MIVWNNFFDEKKSDGSSVSSIDKEKVSSTNNDAPEPSKTLAPDYESMKYASLRTLCKQRGINAAGKKSGPNKEIDAGGTWKGCDKKEGV